MPLARLSRFGSLELDLATGELRKGGVRIKLQEQPFQVLRALLERPDEVVTREELRERLWPGDTFVEFDDGLNTAVRKIRQALGDSADNPRFVETLPRRGYRFIAPVAGDVQSRQAIPHNPQEAAGGSPRPNQTIRLVAATAMAVAAVFALGASWDGSNPSNRLRPGRCGWYRLPPFRERRPAPPSPPMGPGSHSPGMGKDLTTTTSISRKSTRTRFRG